MFVSKAGPSSRPSLSSKFLDRLGPKGSNVRNGQEAYSTQLLNLHVGQASWPGIPSGGVFSSILPAHGGPVTWLITQPASSVTETSAALVGGTIITLP